jgi:hypothetical protein
MHLTFLDATQTVTGSRYLLACGGPMPKPVSTCFVRWISIRR